MGEVVHFKQLKRETSFLVNYVFESWTHFESLAIFGYAGDVNGLNFGDINNKIELEYFIISEEQLNEDPDLCAFFTYLNSMRQDNMNFIVFVSYFDTKQIDNSCKIAIDGINQVANKITFITLGQEVDDTSLRMSFPESMIVEWNITNETPAENWEQVFWDAYGCSGPVPS